MGPAAPAQEEVWLSCALGHDAPLFAVSIRLLLRGKVNISLLEQAVSAVVARHEALRTTYHVGTDGLVQQPGDPYPVGITLCDLSGLDENSRDATGATVYRQDARAPFDLQRGPILRATLIKRAAGEFALVFTVHHIAIDGWSMGVFTKDLEKVHSAYGRGDLPVMSEQTLRYCEFARLQRERVAACIARGDLEEIKERFRVPPLVFNMEKRCEPGGSWQGEHVQLRFSRRLLELMSEFGRREKATQFIVLTAALWVVLYAHSGATRFVMASDYANRTEPDSESVIGLFVSQIVLKAGVEPEAAFTEVVALARREMQQALRYTECPVSMLLPDSADPKTAPPFRIKLAFQPAIAYPELADLTVAGAEVLSEWAKFDLLFSVQVSPGGVSVDLQYRQAMFDRQDMIALLEDLESVACRALQQPSLRVASLVGELMERRQSAHRNRWSALKRELLVAAPQAHEPVPLTEIGQLDVPAGKLSPMVVHARVRGVSLKHWVGANRTWIEDGLAVHRAILFRNFHITAGGFQDVAAELIGELMSYVEGATPREKKGPRTYTSTLFPQSQHIELHNELSSAMVFPGRIAFFCAKPAISGGETPLADVHLVYALVPEPIRSAFSRRGWMLVRNFHKGFGLSWQQAFETEDREVVERYCASNDIEHVWERDGNLRLRQVRAAVMIHPGTRLPVWFNHVAFWHESRLEAGMRTMLLKEFGREGLPFNTYYGDGGAIDAETIDVIRRAYDSACTWFPWQRNDLLYLDNIGVAHGRRPFTGPRDLLVSMGRPCRREMVAG